MGAIATGAMRLRRSNSGELPYHRRRPKESLDEEDRNATEGNRKEEGEGEGEGELHPFRLSRGDAVSQRPRRRPRARVLQAGVRGRRGDAHARARGQGWP